MSEHDTNWEQVSLLLSRQAYLNQLRVGAIQVYLIVVAAVLALLGGDKVPLDHDLVIPLGCCLLSVGMLVFLFDLRCRARAFAVAIEVSSLVRSPRDPPTDLGSRRLFDEDFVFAAIAMVVNSALLFVLLKLSAEQILGYAVTVIIALIFLFVQASSYLTQWPRLSKKMSAWPDGFRRDSDTTGTSNNRHSQYRLSLLHRRRILMKTWFPLGFQQIFQLGGWIGLVYTIASALEVPRALAAVMALALFVIAVIVWAISELYRDPERKFRLEGFKKGQVAYENFEDARDSILVSHFTTACPTKAYREKMLGKMEEPGVRVSRIVGRTIVEESKDWLVEFEEHPRYNEYHVDSKLPFDFLVVDRKRLVLALPSSTHDTEFTQALIFSNERLASIFADIFTILAESGTKKQTTRTS